MWFICGFPSIRLDAVQDRSSTFGNPGSQPWLPRGASTILMPCQPRLSGWETLCAKFPRWLQRAAPTKLELFESKQPALSTTVSAELHVVFGTRAFCVATSASYLTAVNNTQQRHCKCSPELGAFQFPHLGVCSPIHLGVWLGNRIPTWSLPTPPNCRSLVLHYPWGFSHTECVSCILVHLFPVPISPTQVKMPSSVAHTALTAPGRGEATRVFIP